MTSITRDPRGINRRIDFTVTDALVRRFWSRVQKGDESECWFWTAGMRNGYGAIKHQGHVLSAHRVAFVITHGTPGAGLVIAHKCDNRACCNPSHLEAITPGQNNTDARGRLRFHLTRGEDHAGSKLTNEIVTEAWRLRGEGASIRQIAETLDVSYETLRGVLYQRSWKHLVPDWARKSG